VKAAVGIAALLAALAAFDAAATDTASGAAGDGLVTEQIANEDRVICKREAAVGSHISRRVCRTAKQVRDEREDAQSTIRDIHSGTGTRAAAAGGPVTEG